MTATAKRNSVTHVLVSGRAKPRMIKFPTRRDARLELYGFVIFSYGPADGDGG
jgi:hypothetical protein